jgi:hypothetical protein
MNWTHYFFLTLYAWSKELYVGQPSSEYALSVSNGVIVLINNKLETPVFTDGIAAPTGAFTNIQVSRSRMIKLPKPYSECTDDATIEKSNLEIVHAAIEFHGTYSREACYDACFQQSLIELCQCYVNKKYL